MIRARGLCQPSRGEKSRVRTVARLFDDNENFLSSVVAGWPAGWPAGWDLEIALPVARPVRSGLFISMTRDCPRPVIYLIFPGNRAVRVLFYWSVYRGSMKRVIVGREREYNAAPIT